MITSATYRKQLLFARPEDLDLLHDAILELADRQGWKLDAWAVFANHYHVIGQSPDQAGAPGRLTTSLHRRTAIELNRRHGTPGRTVWYRSWPSRITFERSYLARLAYVHFNAVRHGLVNDPAAYRWSSARWFEDHAPRPFYESVVSMRIDRVHVADDFL